jgi:integrase
MHESEIRYVRRFLDDICAWGWPQRPRRQLLCREDLPRCKKKRRRNPNRFSTSSQAFVPLPGNPLHLVLKRYLDILSATVRPRTLEQSTSHLLAFVEFIRERFPEINSFTKLERIHVESWLGGLAARHPAYGNSTRQGYIRSARRFLDELREWGWPDSPAIPLLTRKDLPPSQRYLPRPFTPAVDRRLMKELRRKGDLVSLGLILARNTGLRVGELARLKLECLTEHRDGATSIRVPLGKLRSEREVPIDRRTADLIRLIRRKRGKRPATTDPETGKPLDLLLCHRDGVMIYRNVFNYRLKSAAKDGEIEENVHAHRLRHTYATDLLRNGVSLPGIMKLLGHRTLRMTLRYAAITNEDLGRDYLAAVEKANRRYCKIDVLAALESRAGSETNQTVEFAFDQLLARLQALRFDEEDSQRRKKLQRVVERLRRVQKDLAAIID